LALPLTSSLEPLPSRFSKQREEGRGKREEVRGKREEGRGKR
jgi:hypothetical protein